ncbi:MAG: succinate--CoA ligase subunit alpha [Gemmataceae bacterium]
MAGGRVRETVKRPETFNLRESSQSILVDSSTKVLCQGITGKSGAFHTDQCLLYGSQFVGGVTPGRGGQTWTGEVRQGAPIFNTVAGAVKKTGPDDHDLRPAGRRRPTRSWKPRTPASASSSPSPKASRCWTWPTLEQHLNTANSRLVGPNCPGVITPGQCKIGIMPGYIHKPCGPGEKGVGVLSRSGTLTYEAVFQLSQLGYPQSTCVGIGGDPVIGTNQIDLLEMFEKDPGTSAILMIGEIGGTAEEQAAEYVTKHVKKPVAAFIAGQTAPPGRRMGHAGAIISGGSGSASDKIAALQKAGIEVAPTPADLGSAVQKAIAKKK